MHRIRDTTYQILNFTDASHPVQRAGTALFLALPVELQKEIHKYVMIETFDELKLRTGPIKYD